MAFYAEIENHKKKNSQVLKYESETIDKGVNLPSLFFLIY